MLITIQQYFYILVYHGDEGEGEGGRGGQRIVIVLLLFFTKMLHYMILICLKHSNINEMAFAPGSICPCARSPIVNIK